MNEERKEKLDAIGAEIGRLSEELNEIEAKLKAISKKYMKKILKTIKGAQYEFIRNRRGHFRGN